MVGPERGRVHGGMDLRERVGLNVRAIRLQRGFSQEELAARSAVHQTYLSGVERGKRNATVLVLGRIASALAVDVRELFRCPSDT